jgi:hypothetical protein
MREACRCGAEALQSTGCALDAVTAAISALEVDFYAEDADVLCALSRSWMVHVTYFFIECDY